MKNVNEFICVLKKYTQSHNIRITEDENGEFYFSKEDKEIHLGAKEDAMTLEDVYKSFHEGAHSTMLISGRKAENYALEEVVADCAASKILSKLGVYSLNEDKSYDTVRAVYLLEWVNISYSACWLDRILKDSGLTSGEVFEKINGEIFEIIRLILKEDK